jgi:crotonobetainyl-CoA:carnitine CoA-transferase CaiB-like acyl-CoA transferase
MSGAMFSAGSADDPPAPASTYAVDAITAYSAFEGALAALLHRERTGEGQLVTVNMLDAAIAVQIQELSVFTVGGFRTAASRHTGTPISAHRTACSRRPTAT